MREFLDRWAENSFVLLVLPQGGVRGIGGPLRARRPTMHGSSVLTIFKNILRAPRPAFTPVAFLPFVCGTVIRGLRIHVLDFLIGLAAVVATSLSANLMNDYADSRSGADWQDTDFHRFFGGSKLIQQGVFSERSYLNAAILLACVAGLFVTALAVRLSSPGIVPLYALVLFLAWSYSHRPLQFSYRRLGEPIVFLLFGPVPLMGAHFIQTRGFPTVESSILSMPFGFLATAVLFSNEVPDFSLDKAVGKRTWVSVTGPQRAYVVYGLLVCGAYAAVIAGLALHHLGPLSLLSFAGIAPALRATRVLRKNHGHKTALAESSRATVALHLLVGLALILDAAL